MSDDCRQAKHIIPLACSTGRPTADAAYGYGGRGGMGMGMGEHY